MANRSERRAYERQNKLATRAKERMTQRGMGGRSPDLSKMPRFGAKASADRRGRR